MLRVDLEWEIQRMRAGVKAKNWVMNPYISIYYISKLLEVKVMRIIYIKYCQRQDIQSQLG